MVESNPIFFCEVNIIAMRERFLEFCKSRQAQKTIGFDSIIDYDKKSCIDRISRYTVTLVARCVNPLLACKALDKLISCTGAMRVRKNYYSKRYVS